MAMYWNARKKLLDIANSTLTKFSNSFALTACMIFGKSPKKYTLFDRLKWSPHEAYGKRRHNS